MKQLLRLDWDVIAGLLAAVAALVLHFLHIIESSILLNVAVILIALLFLRDLRRERQADRIEEQLRDAVVGIGDLRQNLVAPEVVLVGPRQIRLVAEGFSARAKGEMVWFHVCLSMFIPPALFDSLLRPAIENPQVRSIQFILDEEQRELWDREVVPKVERCNGRDKVLPPRWTRIHENVSLIISDAASNTGTECLLSFWGEPFMARATGRDVPRYIFHVQPQSELVGRFVDLVRSYRIQS